MKKPPHNHRRPESLKRLEAACRQNALQFSREAALLFDAGSYARAFFLAESGREELAKAQATADFRLGDLSEKKFWEVFANHPKKFSYLKRSVTEQDGAITITFDQELGIVEKQAREVSLYVAADRTTHEPSTPESEISHSAAQKALRALNEEIDASNFLDGLGGASSRTAVALRKRDENA